MRELLARIFGRRPLIFTPVTVRADDDLILTVPDWRASEDVAAFLNAAQAQFPGVRIHLLGGFGQVQVQRKRRACECACNSAVEPGRGKESFASIAARAPRSSKQRNVLLLSHLSGFRVVAVSIPVAPEGKGDEVEESQ